MEITTGIGCKNACVYCPQSKLIKAYKSNIIQMSFETFKKCLNKIPLDVRIAFSGMSEPWLNPECTKMLLYAYDKGYKIIAFTTLVGMTLQDVDRLKRVSFDRFWVHLASDGGEEKIKVDDNYLEVLRKVIRDINGSYFHFRGKNLHNRLKTEPALENKIDRRAITTRAGNVEFDGSRFPRRKRGVIGCDRLHINTLLPNGDVVLCCLDYGLRHILGNLLISDYRSLFVGPEFLRIKNGLRDGSEDILCRYCDQFAYSVSLFAKIYNNLVTLRSFKDLRRLMRKII